MLFHNLDEIYNLVRVANLIVIPRNNLYEVIREVYTGVSVEDRSQRAAEEVR